MWINTVGRETAVCQMQRISIQDQMALEYGLLSTMGWRKGKNIIPCLVLDHPICKKEWWPACKWWMQGRLNNSDGFLSSFLSAKKIEDKQMRLPLLLMQQQLIPSSLPTTEQTTCAYWLSSGPLNFGFLQKPLVGFLIQTVLSWRAEEESKMKWGPVGVIQFPGISLLCFKECVAQLCLHQLQKSLQWIRVPCKVNVAWFADPIPAYVCKYFSIFQNGKYWWTSRMQVQRKYFIGNKKTS